MNERRPDQDNSPLLKPGMKVHLVGIGGAGISAIARVLLGRGFSVSGSDQQQNDLTSALAEQGATIFSAHKAENVGEADLLVISSAIPESNPEVQEARRRGVPVLKRSDLLGALMEGTVGIAVAGTHGKTTTTGMIAQILMEAELDPTVIVGGVLPALGTNGRHGTGDHFIIEADEYDHMFLGLRPQTIIVTNLEHDHPDIFPTMAEYTDAFQRFVSLLPDGGSLIVCADDQGVQQWLPQLSLSRAVMTTYQIAADENAAPANIRALDCRPNPLGGTDFLVKTGDKLIGLARLRVPGLHNVRNALAAIAVALELEIDFSIIRQALADFGGVGRRFQVLGTVGSVTVIDDYAHHPTEIQATLSAARQRYPGRRLWAVWQPHTFSRTKLLLDKFATSFEDADRVMVLDIYRSREKDTLDMAPDKVLRAMKHSNVEHVSGLHESANFILDRLLPDDVIMTLSAGDGNTVGQLILDGLRARVGKD